jgi:hypothetical protein
VSRFWFNFTVENTNKDQRIIFNIVNIRQDISLRKENEKSEVVRLENRLASRSRDFNSSQNVDKFQQMVPAVSNNIRR